MVCFRLFVLKDRGKEPLMAKYTANYSRIIQIVVAAIITWIIVDPLLHIFG